ncbi:MULTISPECIES: aspartyl-phosphate phosphatase Spo0E family protein [Paenibacillus]|uniref:Spo0E family sporulation regulatory protein-aspartic acid phosphatase n=4 Tax=Paenibacillus TaxID=44249 RepID=A0A6L8V2L0_9BACL|nr:MULTISPECIES: aspartyl-phosphate phosphatase Spo0E family protein [Paenibacillus]MBA2940410.1 aspartyl-phosphate phosphatase Spo0E family protein [Paenibacillus sp. CGMCC 1.16610]MCY9657959.1 aspartyl-phosphate phosphatase Spo0E family protein [Paenibacillus anseongense]MDU0203182.1 aspartyl-phosphate phosphatase Spo0E family protein [Paenibacillus sp. PFR10]MEB4792886.1 aspartyl-phosphate phosphatase Spo0E family protein [Paenibacillus chondroitinus]MEC0270689.1 aspartyl-phosphate phosphat
MAFMEYQLSTYRKHLQINEQDFEQRWLTKRAKKRNSLNLLEEEIHSLRRRLEQMVLDGEEMTSESVVELSTILDLKINEYMNNWKKSR